MTVTLTVFQSVNMPLEHFTPSHACSRLCISACLCSINIRLYILNVCSRLVFWHLGNLMAPVNVSTNPQLPSSTSKTFAWANASDGVTVGVYCEIPAKNMPLLCIVLCGMIITRSILWANWSFNVVFYFRRNIKPYSPKYQYQRARRQ